MIFITYLVTSVPVYIQNLLNNRNKFQEGLLSDTNPICFEVSLAVIVVSDQSTNSSIFVIHELNKSFVRNTIIKT
jgi:hypothetical protein